MKIEYCLLAPAHVPDCDFFENFSLKEKDIGLCSFAVMDNFSQGFLVHLISKYDIAAFSSSEPSAYFEPLPVSDGKRVSYFLLISSQYANGCCLICLSGLNRKLQIHNSYFRLICSGLPI